MVDLIGQAPLGQFVDRGPARDDTRMLTILRKDPAHFFRGGGFEAICGMKGHRLHFLPRKITI